MENRSRHLVAMNVHDVDPEAEERYPVRFAFVNGPDGEPIELFRERAE